MDKAMNAAAHQATLYFDALKLYQFDLMETPFEGLSVISKIEISKTMSS